MKQLPVFDFINKYNEETAKSLAKQQKYTQAVKMAEMQKQGLNIRYEAAFKAAYLDEEDKAAEAELEEISELLEKAERDLTNKKMQQQAAQGLNKPSITPQQVDSEFRAFLASYKAEFLAPAAKEMLKAKEAYVNAVLEYERLARHGEAQAKLATYSVNPNAVSVPYSVTSFSSAADRMRTTISEVDLVELSQGKKPSSLKPITKPVKGKDGVTRFMPVEEGEA